MHSHIHQLLYINGLILTQTLILFFATIVEKYLSDSQNTSSKFHSNPKKSKNDPTDKFSIPLITEKK